MTSSASDARFVRLADISEALTNAPSPDEAARAAAAARTATLTKPTGALGRLEELASWAAGWRGAATPRVARAQVLVFAGDHGVVARGVSPYPSDVTAQMVANFNAGGAAVNQLSALAGASLSVVPLQLGEPTADFTEESAMDEAGFCAAASAGWAAIDPTADVIALGEMGIGNTTAAAAVACALFDGRPTEWVGRGAGADDAMLARKAEAVRLGVVRHANARARPLEMLRRLGGREMAAIAGACLAARHARIPVLLDGFISCASVAPLKRRQANALDHCLAAHRSAEAAHDRLLAELELTPLLDLGLRLGEGSGAALALPIYRAALACHSDMATFESAGVSGPSD